MRALSIRQPFVELILRGIKTAEYRSRPTRIIGERFYLYAAKQWAMASGECAAGSGQRAEPGGDVGVWRGEAMSDDGRFFDASSGDSDSSFSLPPSSFGLTSDDLSPAAPPPWMVELAIAVKLFGSRGERLAGGLATGVIVGTAVIEKVTPRDDGLWQWHLTGVERARRLRKPRGRPQPVWFFEEEKRGMRD